MTSAARAPSSFLRPAAGLVAAAAFILALGCGGAPSTEPGSQGTGENEPTVAKNVRDGLAKAAELDTCRAALEQLNNYLSRQPSRKTPPLSPEERTLLEGHFALDAKELAEIESPTFTTLDAHYLDLCLLMRDAARSQSLNGLDALERAQQAFAWVMREVRLRAGDDEPLPPQSALRRGWGTAPERGLVFLCLLNQLRIPSCIIAYGAEEVGKPPFRIWAAGALIERQIYLFDLRLGLPLPGPGGKGVATLAQLKKDPIAILSQIPADPKHPYDVTAEQIKRLEVRVSVLLTALAPRMRYLQNEILGSDVTPDSPQLAADPRLIEQLGEATRNLGVSVRGWTEATRSLRSFLSPEQGGSDAPAEQGQSRQRRFEQELIPWHVLPEQIRNMPGTAGQPLLQVFGQPFREFYLGARRPRDLMLRGRFDEATRELVGMSQDLEQHRVLPAGLQRQIEEQVGRWSKDFIDANADLILAQEAVSGAQTTQVRDARARVEELWRNGSPFLTALISSATAEPRGSEVTYHLALCKHELAVRAQARSRGTDAAREKADDAWKEALYWWDKFANDYALTPERYRRRLTHIRDLRQGRGQAVLLLPYEVESLARDLSTAVSARLLHAEALVRLHQPDRARALLEGLTRDLRTLEGSGDLDEVEKLDRRGAALWYLTAAPYRVGQLK
jgi:hypothetical protein